MLSGFEKAYEIGTSYRAEKSHTYRHLTEFWQLDVEMSFIDGIDDIMRIEERLLVHILKKIKKIARRKLSYLCKDRNSEVAFPSNNLLGCM